MLLGVWILCFAILMLFIHRDIDDFAEETSTIFSPKFVKRYTKIFLFIGAPYWLCLELWSQYVLWRTLNKVKRILKDVCKRNGLDYKKEFLKYKVERNDNR